MCNYDILYHNQHGYAVQCKHCLHIKLAFGTTALTFNEEQFYDFKHIADGYWEINKYQHCRTQKQIQIPTSHSAVSLVFTLDELEQLSAIMEEAHINLEVQRLLA